MPRPLRTTLIVAASLAAVLVVAIVALVVVPRPTTTASGASTLTPLPTGTPTLSPTPSPSATPSFNKSQYSIGDASSLWVVVNKTRPLNPVDYVPSLAPLNLPGVAGQMRPEAASALQQMFADYHTQTGDQLSVQSPYRSYTTQVSVYNGWVAKLGKAQADRQSARPGFSEHQTGLAVDIDTATSQAFGATPAGKWLAANSWRYGFIVRYPDGQEAVTGYEYEPWHFRYLGVELATQMHSSGIPTLEQFFGLPDAPNYSN